MPLGAQLRPSACGRVTPPQRWPSRPFRLCGRRHLLLVRASAEGSPAEEGPREISLERRVPGAGYTFMLAGALKILTMGWVATGAPRECVRTAAGQYGQLLLIPVGLLLCLIAKKVVDAGLHESGRFMSFVLGITAFLYFGLYSVLYRYEPRTWHAQQRIQAAAVHDRSPYTEAATGGGHRNNKFIIQRQLEGEYDTRTSAYYSRAPEMQMDAVEAQMSGLPAGMVGGGGGAAAAVPPGLGPTVAERQSGMSSLQWRSQQQQLRRQRGAAAAVPSMYESSSRIPGLEDSEF
ncbi:hypothetical protein VOLCADRAFT_106352 [Volvox carteri f. nagariensis]|uniref:Uncharacterized protein n=1 Tax=Volvox carteri f. nagariensis TaxID=3068 RepID=D8U6U1_VOLCA|nr:uncharacterized protein VOLCADRAFT_106352 [Volvox carteri f. nagariensis]EFJ44570.1 hypothetical protein VOLCADRAFT_106352 [Volvox carteri f. nagariensis]|eukprot:XP_002954420.1 hypothetical protein VOLCADRAFT_106352 [Volvox carteri f. nagariensis]